MLGDMVDVRAAAGTTAGLPGLAPVAIQQGRYAARLIRRRLRGRSTPPFHYRDKGNLATIGRSSAVADIKGVRLAGFLAWLVWLTIHLFYLIGFQNRAFVLLRWSITYVTRGRGARLIPARHAQEQTDRPGPAVYQRVINSDHRDETPRRAAYNLGNLLAKQGQAHESAAAYNRAINSKHPTTRRPPATPCRPVVTLINAWWRAGRRLLRMRSVRPGVP